MPFPCCPVSTHASRDVSPTSLILHMDTLNLTLLSVCVCVCLQFEDSGKEHTVCQAFSHLGEGAHQVSGCQICPCRGDTQPVTMAGARPPSDPAQSKMWPVSITFKEALTTNMLLSPP